MNSQMTPVSLLKEIRLLPKPTQLVLLAFPLVFLIVSIWMHYTAGPFWLWSNLDPDYWYLFDSLNMINGDAPKHIAHPGTTVQWIGAILIKVLHPLLPTEDINRLVLTQPETYLTLIGRILIGLNFIALIVIGFVGFLAFRDLTAALLLQTGPFLSQLTFKWSVHVSPEPLLLTVVMGLGTLTLVAVRDDKLEQRRNQYALAFAIVAGFGMVTKVTSAGLYLLPVFLLWNRGSLIRYAIFTFAAMIVFSLPAVGAYEAFIDRMIIISESSGYHGSGAHTFIDLATYPGNLIRVSSRPMFFGVLLIGLGLVVALYKKSRREGTPFPVLGRAMAGLCLAFFAQALLVAKHPAGHYMVPALCMSALGLALIYLSARELLTPAGEGRKRLRLGFSILLVVLVFAQGKSLKGLNKEFSQRSANAAAINETPYGECAKIYFWPASHPLYALFQASATTLSSFDDKLAQLYPDPSIHFFTTEGELHGMKGLRDPDLLPQKFKCIYARGERPGGYLKRLDDAFAPLKISGRCQDGDEAVFTWGLDCKALK